MLNGWIGIVPNPDKWPIYSYIIRASDYTKYTA